MSSFKKTTVSTLPAIIEPLSDAAKFWKKSVHPATVFKELNAINSIDINNQNELIATSSSKVVLFDPSSSEKKRTFLSPNHTALYCGHFRRDNAKIFATGSADGIIRLWECKKSKPLRLLGSDDHEKSRKHSSAVHRVNFHGLNQIFSCGDDKEIKLWDFTENVIVSKFGTDTAGVAHEDYIRASCLIDNASSFVSGSYDHTVKIWDIRSPSNPNFVNQHKQPVESITNRNLLVISASGTTIQVFDMVAGKNIRILDNIHHKTITCVHNHGSYLLTASIDGHLKIYDQNFNVVTSFSYVPSQLLSCCYNGSYLAVGANDGVLSINKISNEKHEKSKNIPSSSLYEDDPFFGFGASIPKKPKQLHWDGRKDDNKDTVIVQRVSYKSKIDLHEKLLRKFEYSKALTRVLKSYSRTKPEIVVNCMQELIRRNGLKRSLAGREYWDLKRIINFLIRNLNDLRFTRILLDVSMILLDVYAEHIVNCTNSKIRILFKNLNYCINQEIESIEKMTSISGQLQFLINSQIK